MYVIFKHNVSCYWINKIKWNINCGTYKNFTFLYFSLVRCYLQHLQRQKIFWRSHFSLCINNNKFHNSIFFIKFLVSMCNIFSATKNIKICFSVYNTVGNTYTYHITGRNLHNLIASIHDVPWLAQGYSEYVTLSQYIYFAGTQQIFIPKETQT